MPGTTDYKPDPEQFAPGSFGCHEAMHVAMILAETVDAQLCQHPTIMANDQWQELAQRACDTLHDLYQSIAAEHVK